MEEPTTTRAIPGLDAPDTGDALVSLSIATAVRDIAISVGIVLGLLYLFPVLSRVISSPGGYQHPRYIALAGPKLQASTGLSTHSIGPLTGPGVLAACVAAALLVGGLLLRLRDA
jgi:ABC-2 type transport system permease protein